jgi:hypothetical protein
MDASRATPSARPVPGLLLAALALAGAASAQVDWRHAQSPVKNQGNRGTCAAFAICGALETFPGVPTDLSEQLLYATLKLHQNGVVGWMRKLGRPGELREGDLFDAYVPLFELLGTCHESYLPYDPDPKRAAPSVPDELKRYLELAHVSPDALERLRDGFGKYGFLASDCRQLAEAETRDVATLQQLLAAGHLAIPIGYPVHGPSWSRLHEVGNFGADGKRVFVHPGMMMQFSWDGSTWRDYGTIVGECLQRGETFVAAVQAGRLHTRLLGDAKEYGGHAVLLVGYDDRGFLAKNSWGTEWGDGGYFRIAYDYHRLYAGKALAIGKARIRHPSLNPFERSRRLRDGRFRVKVQPRGSAAVPAWQLSTWMHEPRDAGYGAVQYSLRGRPAGAGAEWRLLANQVVLAGDERQRQGEPWQLDAATMLALTGCAELQLELHLALDVFPATEGPAKPMWLRSVVSPTFAPRLAGAIDLEMR